MARRSLQSAKRYSARLLKPSTFSPDRKVFNFVVLLLAAVAGRASGDPPADLFSPREYFLPGHAGSFINGDFDGDGSEDLLVSSSLPDVLLFYRNDGKGHLQPAVSSALMHTAALTRPADLDGDGDLDVILPSMEIDGFIVMLNQGNGTFELSETYVTGGWQCDVGDLDGDGDVDVVSTASWTAEFLTVVLNDGTGHFVSDGEVHVDGRPRSLHLADLDHDQDLDLAVKTETNEAAIFLNSGEATFSESERYALPAYTRTFGLEDLNGDTLPDLVAIGVLPQVVETRINEGDASFRAPVSSPVQTDFMGVMDVVDVNDDGKADVLTRRLWNHMDVNLGDGSGSFAAACSVNVGEYPASILHADLDGSGGAEILLLESRHISVIRNDGYGCLGAPLEVALSAYAGALILADFDGDDDLDVLSSAGPEGVEILFNDGAGAGPALSLEGQQVVAGDIDNDGDLDVIDAIGGDSDVNVHLNRGDGTFDLHASFQVCSGAQAVSLADFTGDGWLDLAVSCVWEEQSSILVNQRNGTFAPGLDIPLAASDTASSDLNGDGRADLVLTDWIAEGIRVYLNDGRGGFERPVAYPCASKPKVIAIADVDADGDLDVAVSGHISVCVWHNLGDGTLDAPVEHGGDLSPHHITFADMDADGAVDLLASNVNGSNMVIWFNDGRGLFNAEHRYGTGTFPLDMAAGDLDGDGDVDVASTDEDGNLLFHRNRLISAAACPGDLDGDGVVGASDLPLVVVYWGPCPLLCSADVDGDGVVGFADLMSLLEAWGPCDP